MKTVTRRLLQKLPRDDDIPRQTDSVLYESYILRQPFLAGKTKIPSEMVEICLYFSWKTENIYDRIDTF